MKSKVDGFLQREPSTFTRVLAAPLCSLCALCRSLSSYFSRVNHRSSHAPLCSVFERALPFSGTILAVHLHTPYTSWESHFPPPSISIENRNRKGLDLEIEVGVGVRGLNI
ncbi:hypothetical protein NC653_010608 [Populus alba x Populus x berolinensis]|uniref:Uncharacterized protein n=1 Tax=Populus alba x Populus x berolinensis TaxID=444605 RepID=A0AAD6W6K8_9ROSI|nr:hypothetical protein NC653_010608 [Populus alba x Populus x berolinensis]